MIQSVRFRSFFMATCPSVFFSPTAITQPFCVHALLIIQVHSIGNMPLRPNKITLSFHDCLDKFQPRTFFLSTPESHVFVPIVSRHNLLHITPTSSLHHLGPQIEDPLEHCLLSMTALKRQIWEAVPGKKVAELTGNVFCEERYLGITQAAWL